MASEGTVRHARLGRRRIPRKAVGMVAIAALAAVPTVIVANSAYAATSIVVNSAAFGGKDYSPGDGVCETAENNGVCTMRAAVEELNAVSRQPGEATITVASSIPLGTRMTGTLVAADRMLTEGNVTSYSDVGAFLEITQPVTIDLGHRLLVDYSNTQTQLSTETAAFYINASNVNIYNADHVLSTGSSFVVGPNVSDILIDGQQDGTRATVATINNNFPERFVVFREGITNVTVQHMDVYGFDTQYYYSGIFAFNNMTGAAAPMTNIVIDDVDILNRPAGACAAADGSGCKAPFIVGYGSTYANWSTITITGLTFKNMTVQNLGNTTTTMTLAPLGQSATSLDATITDLTIEDNQFLNNTGFGSDYYYAFLTLPHQDKLKGTTSIRRNVFQSSGSGQYYAIYHWGQYTTKNNQNASNITIADNYFNNYRYSGVLLMYAGLVTMTGNTFGTGSSGQADYREEQDDLGAGLLDNYQAGYSGYHTNEGIRTWYPTSAAVWSGPKPAGAYQAEPNAAYADLPACMAVVDVQRGTDTTTYTYPTPLDSKVTLEAYWTVGSDAEVYLGKVSGVPASSAKFLVPVPVGPIQLPDGTVTAVNSDTGATSGMIRVQTHVEGLAQLESSQYSRAVAFTGNCRPAITINQASDQAEDTMGRDLHFTISSSMPLDVASVTTSDVMVTAEPTDKTIDPSDPSKLNPRVVSVTEVPGSGGMLFDVIVHVDDSAKVTVSMGPDTVTSNGVSNPKAATSTDPSVTFVNPLSVTPPKFTVVTGEPNGKTYQIVIAAGAPLPSDVLQFQTLTVQPDGTPPIQADPAAPQIKAGSKLSDPIKVTAAAGEVDPGTPTEIRHTLVSTDTNYNGLLVPSVYPQLFSTDPSLLVEKRAWVANPDGTPFDTSSPETIMATGVEAPRDGRREDREFVCFVYTVTNKSADAWETTLTDVKVTDSDERLGNGGVIGTKDVLGIGESTSFSSCTSLLDLDTTATDIPTEEPADAPADGE